MWIFCLGSVVTVAQQSNDWALVQLPNGREGYVPLSYLTKVEFTQLPLPQLDTREMRTKKRSCASDLDDLEATPTSQPSKPEATDNMSLSFGEVDLCDMDVFGTASDTESNVFLHQYSADESMYGRNSDDCFVVLENFVKKPSGKYLVLHNYYGEQEDDTKILKGDCVTVLNKDDKDWYWIQTAEGAEGFVPRNYLWQATCSPGEKELYKLNKLYSR